MHSTACAFGHLKIDSGSLAEHRPDCLFSFEALNEVTNELPDIIDLQNRQLLRHMLWRLGSRDPGPSRRVPELTFASLKNIIHFDCFLTQINLPFQFHHLRKN